MTYLMFTAGLLIGFVAGVCLYELLVAGPQHRRAQQREWRLQDRANLWQSMWYMESLERLEGEHDTFSKKVSLRAVQ